MTRSQGIFFYFSFHARGELGLWQNQRQARLSLDFHIGIGRFCKRKLRPGQQANLKSLPGAGFGRHEAASAQYARHGLVDGLHAIEMA
jgi:hypothetical protein